MIKKPENMRFLLHISGLYDIALIGANTPIRRRVMYLDFFVKIPNATGKITYRRKRLCLL